MQRAKSCRRRLHYPEKLTFDLLNEGYPEWISRPMPSRSGPRTAPARGGTSAACRRGADRADTLNAFPSARTATFWLLRKFSGWGAERWVPRARFSCVPSQSAQTRTDQVHCYPICYPTVWDKRGLKQTKNAKALENVQQIGTLSDLQGERATVATELQNRCSTAELTRRTSFVTVA